MFISAIVVCPNCKFNLIVRGAAVGCSHCGAQYHLELTETKAPQERGVLNPSVVKGGEKALSAP